MEAEQALVGKAPSGSCPSGCRAGWRERCPRQRQAWRVSTCRGAAVPAALASLAARLVMRASERAVVQTAEGS